jgi:hypothetical protein
MLVKIKDEAGKESFVESQRIEIDGVNLSELYEMFKKCKNNCELNRQKSEAREKELIQIWKSIRGERK